MEGTRLGAWRIGGALGSGGMGRVYSAVADRDACGLPAGTRIALKLVHPHLLETEGFFQRFLREGEVGKAIVHPNVVRTYEADALIHEGVPHHFLVMEFVAGQTLRALLEDLGRVPEELCRHIAVETAHALRAIHRAGVIHRDLKPENVLITADHEVKVMDLGVALLAEEQVRLSQTGAFVGSVRYAAPEQFQGGGCEVDARADLYALGLVLYELASGVHPHGDGDLHTTIRNLLDRTPRRVGEVNPQLSPFFEEVIHTLLAQKPSERLPSADALVSALEGAEDSDWWKARTRALRRTSDRPLRRIRIPRETSVYGRDSELARLEALWERARDGRGQVLILEGEAGIGKTRLVDEFVGRLRRRGEDPCFLFGDFPPGGAATAAGAFVTALCDHFGKEGIDEELTKRLPGAETLVPSFAALLRGEPPPSGAAPLNQDSLQTAFVLAVSSLAKRSPVVLLIDDLHFTSRDGRALFAALAHAVSGHRILLVGTSRPGLPEDWISEVERLPHSTRLPLERLGAKDLGRLLIDAFGSERLARRLALPIATKSDGNPYFVFEIIQDLRESGVLAERADGTWETTRNIERIQIPTSVGDLIRARVAELPDEDRELLDAGACAGFEFDGSLVAEVLGVPRVPALRRFAHLESKHRLLRSVGRRFVFDHHQVQEVLYEKMPVTLREVYHAGLAEALESRAGPDGVAGPAAVEICRHYLEGGDPRAAARHLTPALRSLRASDRRDVAADLAERILEAPGALEGRARLTALIELVAVLDTLGRREAEAARIEEAGRIATRVGEPALEAAVLAGRGWYRIGIDRFEEAREDLSRARDLAREAGDRQVEAHATRDLGIALYCLRRYPEAREVHERHLALAREIGDRRGAASAVGNLGNVLFSLGRHEEAREKYEEWLAESRETGHRRGEAAATGNLGTIHYLLGRYEEARTHHERNRELSRAIGYRLGEARATGWVARSLRALGRYAEASEELYAYRDLSRAVGHAQGEVQAETMLGRLGLDRGDIEGIEPHLAAATSKAEALGRPLWRADALHTTGEIAAELGRDVEAEGALGEALALRRDADHTEGTAATLTALGRMWIARGEPDRARPFLEEAADLAGEIDDPGLGALAQLLLTQLPGSDPATATIAFGEVAERLTHSERMEADFLLWRATGAPEYLADAKRRLAEKIAEAPPERRDALRVRVPLHRAIQEAEAAES